MQWRHFAVDITTAFLHAMPYPDESCLQKREEASCIVAENPSRAVWFMPTTSSSGTALAETFELYTRHA